MKNAVILHGAGDGPESYWIPWLKNCLEKQGFSVFAPKLPNAAHPTLTEQLPFILENAATDEQTVIIGHSAGVPLTFSVLEKITAPIRKAVLVAGYSTPLPEGANDILQKEYDWKKIKNNCGEFVFINSVNDPWGCDDRQGRLLFEKLGGMLIINNQGHMGSGEFNQPYREFPLLLALATETAGT